MPARRLAALLAVLALAATTAACGSDEPSSPAPDLGGGPSGDASDADGEGGDDQGGEDDALPPELPDPPAKGDKVRDGYSVVAGRLPEPRRDREVAEVLVSYMDVRMASFNTGAASPALAGVATGQALTDVQGRAAELHQLGLRTVGDMVVHVDEVDAEDGAATLDACFDNATVDVDRRNRAVESPAAAYDVTATLVEVAKGRWVVQTLAAEATGSC